MIVKTVHYEGAFNLGRHNAHISGLNLLVEPSKMDLIKCTSIEWSAHINSREVIARLYQPFQSPLTVHSPFAGRYNDGWNAGVGDLGTAMQQYDNYGSFPVSGPVVRDIWASLPLVPMALVVGCSHPEVQCVQDRILLEKHMLRYGEFSRITVVGGARNEDVDLNGQDEWLQEQYAFPLAILFLHQSCRFKGDLLDYRIHHAIYGTRLRERGFDVTTYVVENDDNYRLLTAEEPVE